MTERGKSGPKVTKVRLRLMEFTVWAQTLLPMVPSHKQIRERYALDKETAGFWLDDWAELRGKLGL